MTTLGRMAAWGSALALDDVPGRVVESAKDQVLSTFAALCAGYGSDLGPRIAEAFPPPAPGEAQAVPSGVGCSPSHAAFLQAAWSMVLDFDDSMLGGHTGHSTVNVPWAYASGRSGADLLRAQICANEIAARVNTAVALGPLRGQMATHLHLLGAAAARAVLEDLEAERAAEAMGFALTYPAKALYPGFLGSDAKTLAAAWPVRMGLDAVDAVRAGLRGNPAVLDGAKGFLDSFADVPVPAFLEGLGEGWHTETNSFKVHPACAYISATLDAVLDIVRDHDIAPEEVEAIDVHASVLTVGMDVRSGPYLRGPDSLVPTLSFSTPYNVAWAVIDRRLGPEHLRRARIADPRAWSLAERVRVHHDEELTLGALTSDAPIGAALKAAGEDGERYLERMAPGAVDRVVEAVRGAPLRDLEHAEKAVGSRVELRTTDGRTLGSSVRVAAGSAGWGDRAQVRALMRDKYLASAAEVIGEAAAEEACGLLGRLEELGPDEVSRLVALHRPA